MDDEVIQAMADMELSAMEMTRAWLEQNPGCDVDDLYEELEEWHASHVNDAIVAAAVILGVEWTMSVLDNVLSRLASRALEVNVAAEGNRQAAIMANILADSTI